MRPRVRWSRVDSRRANRYVRFAVTPKPICVVTAAIAGTTIIGSFTGICAALTIDGPGPPS
jgi:hypothetical protein